ncbi:phosphopantetheine-binding protein [Streptomyces sp. NPDC086549]|uniref:phosphopantetheine-binding protein n=1 Tax=Streptomyces sp. NPDC086549 TaxID=3365752 RepID=UPI0037F9F053
MSASSVSPVAAVVETHWRAVLGVSESAPQDRFFELGGDSLLAIDLIQRIEQDLKAEVPVDVLFLDGTLAALVEATTKVVEG